MRSSVRFVVSLVAVVVLAAGCGGDDSDEESSSTTAPAVTETTSPATTAPATDPRTPEQLAADRAQAERAVLKLSDLPRGWTAEPNTDVERPELQAALERLASCLGIDPSFIGGRSGAKADSDEFEDDDNNEVENSVTMVSSRERAVAQLDAFRKPETRGCMETYFNTAIQQAVANPGPGQTAPPGVSFGEARVEVLSGAGLNTESIGFRTRVPITFQNQTRDGFFDIVFSLKGRAGITTRFAGIGQPFPAELATSLTNTVIDRAPAS